MTSSFNSTKFWKNNMYFTATVPMETFGDHLEWLLGPTLGTSGVDYGLHSIWILLVFVCTTEKIQ